MEMKFGVISEQKNGFARVHFEEDNIVSDWLPVMVRKTKTDADSWQFEPLEQVVCLVDENCEEGVVLGAVPSKSDPGDAGEAPGKWRKTFSDGTVLQYDKNAHELTVDVKGKITATATGEAKVTSTAKVVLLAPNVEITGAVKITGAVQVIGALSAQGIASVSGGASNKITAEGDIETTGEIKATDFKTPTLSFNTHKHTAPNGPTSGPQP